MKNGRLMSQWAGSALLGAGLLMLAAGPASAADAAKEVATATQHAGYAAQGKSIDMVHSHLHHVVNCLVGPKGEGFDAKQLNPCKGMGDGAIGDTSDPAKKENLQMASSAAQAGLKTTDLDAARKQAEQTQKALEKAH